MSLDHDKFAGYFSTRQLWYMKQAETLPGLQADLDLFRLTQVAGFVINALLQDINPDNPVELHSYGSHSAVPQDDSPHEHYLNQGTLCSLRVNTFWNLQVEVSTLRLTDKEDEPVIDPGTVKLVQVEWWPNDNHDGAMDEYFPAHPMAFSRKYQLDPWTSVSQGISVAEQLDMLHIISDIRHITPPYTPES